MPITESVIVWVYLGLSAVCALFFTIIWKKHQVNKEAEGMAYLGLSFLEEHQAVPRKSGKILINPELMSCRMLIILVSCMLMSSFFWPSTAPQGTLVITDGPLDIDSKWERPIYIVSAYEPYHSIELSRSDNSRGEWRTIDPRPLSVGKRIDIPKKIGVPTPFSAIEYALQFITPREVLYRPTTPPMIRKAVARWERSESGVGQFEVLVNVHQALTSTHTLVLESLEQGTSANNNQSPSWKWQPFAELQPSVQAQLYRWVGTDDQFPLSGKPLRIVLYHNRELVESPYPLCSPLTTEGLNIKLFDHFADYQMIGSLLATLGFTANTVHLPQHSLNQSTVQPLLEISSADSSKRIGVESAITSQDIYTLFGDELSQMSQRSSNHLVQDSNDQIDQLLNFERVWAPLSPDSKIIQNSISQIDPQGRLALTVPSIPLAPTLITQFRPLNIGRPLLWLSEPSSQTDSWHTSTVVVSHHTSSQGHHNYHFGLDIGLLAKEADQWLNTILAILLDEERVARSRCYEWDEGEPLRVALPPQFSFGKLDRNGTVVPINHQTYEKYKVRVEADHQGLLILSPRDLHLKGISKSSEGHDQENLFIARRAFFSDFPQGQPKKFSQKVDELNLSPWLALRFLTRQWSSLQHNLIYSLCGLWLILMLVYAAQRTLQLMYLIVVIVTVLGVSILGLKLVTNGQVSIFELFEGKHTELHLSNLSNDSAKDTTVDSLIKEQGLTWGSRHSLQDNYPMLVSHLEDLHPTHIKAKLNSHQGPKWLLPNVFKAAPGIELLQYAVRRVEEQKKLLVKVLFKSSYSVDVDVYIDNKRRRLTIQPTGTLFGIWIPDRGQALIPLKLESHQKKGSNQYKSEELRRDLALKPETRRSYWAWGPQVKQWLTATGIVNGEGRQRFLNDFLPDSLLGIALHRVAPKYLNESHVQRLVDWIKRGGTLFMLGTLNEQARMDYAKLENNSYFKVLTPLSTHTPIPQQRTAQIVFLVDRSGSTDMAAGGPGLEEIANRLSDLVEQLAPRDEVMMISFGGGTELSLPPTLRSKLNDIPSPLLSRGSTVLHPALELALTYRRPSLPAHWVIVTDGDWGDDPQRLSGSLFDRIKASDPIITVAKFKSSFKIDSELTCPQLCQQFVEEIGAKLVDWNEISISHLHTSIHQPNQTDIYVEGTSHWGRKVGGSLPTVESYTAMSARRQTQVLARVNGLPLLAEKQIGEGRVLQLMTDRWDLNREQWRSILGIEHNPQVPWQVLLRPSTHPTKGLGAIIVAESHHGQLSGRATLSLGEDSDSYWWRSVNAGDSVLSDCQLSKHLPDTESVSCPPVWLAKEEADVILLRTPAQAKISDQYLVASDIQGPDNTAHLARYNQQFLFNQVINNEQLDLDQQPQILTSDVAFNTAIESFRARQERLNPWLYIILIFVAILIMIGVDVYFWRKTLQAN